MGHEDGEGRTARCPVCGQNIIVEQDASGYDIFDYHPDPDNPTEECLRSGLRV